MFLSTVLTTGREGLGENFTIDRNGNRRTDVIVTIMQAEKNRDIGIYLESSRAIKLFDDIQFVWPDGTNKVPLSSFKDGAAESEISNHGCIFVFNLFCDSIN